MANPDLLYKTSLYGSDGIDPEVRHQLVEANGIIGHALSPVEDDDVGFDDLTVPVLEGTTLQEMNWVIANEEDDNQRALSNDELIAIAQEAVDNADDAFAEACARFELVSEANFFYTSIVIRKLQAGLPVDREARVEAEYLAEAIADGNFSLRDKAELKDVIAVVLNMRKAEVDLEATEQALLQLVA